MSRFRFLGWLTVVGLLSCFSIAVNATKNHKDSLFVRGFSGEFEVGTQTFYWRDEQREETFTTEKGDNRFLTVRLFYPADANDDAEKLSLLPPHFEDFYLNYSYVDDKDLDIGSLASQRWPISLNTPISAARKQYPLIIFSHGYYFLPEMHTFLSAELASYGYIVASVNHTYGSSWSKLADGRVTGAVDHPEDDFGAYHAIWANDQLFVLQQMRKLATARQSGFHQKLSDSVSIVGHSYGGSSGYHAATMSQELDAVVNLDGRIFDLQDTSITTPFLYIHSDSESQQEAFEHVNAPGYSVIFEKLHHNSFSDLGLYWQRAFPGETIYGKMSHPNPQRLVVQFIHQFIQQVSQGKSSVLFSSLELQDKSVKVIAYPHP